MMLQLNKSDDRRYLRRSHRVGSLALVLAAFLLTAMLSACNSSPTLPSISDFSAAKATIASYSTNTLSWAASNAASYTLTVSGGTSTTTTTAVTGTSTTVTTPNVTASTVYTYTLTAYSQTGAYATRSITVNVVPYATPGYVSVKYYGTPTSNASALTSGISTEFATLTWSATDTYANSTMTVTATPTGGTASTPVNIAPASSTTNATTGVTTYSYSYTPTPAPTVKTVYTVTATNKVTGDVQTATATVKVEPAPTITGLVATPSTLNYGSSFAFSIGSYSCGKSFTVTPAINSVTSASTILALTKIVPTANTNYVFTCTNTSGDFTTTTVPVIVQPSVKLWASNTVVSSNNASATLNWVANNATSVQLYSFTPGSQNTTTSLVADVTSNTSNSQTVTLSSDTSYFITATNSNNVSVNSAPVTVSVTSGLEDITSFLAYQNSTASSMAIASTNPSNANGGKVYLIPVFANVNTASPNTVDTATITYVDGSGNTQTVTNAAVSGTAYPVTPSATTTYTLTVTNPSLGTDNTQTKTLRVVAGSVSTFEGQGLKISTAESGFEFITGTASSSTLMSPYALAAIPESKGGGFYVYDNFACAVGELTSAGALSLAAGVPMTQSLYTSSTDCAIYSGSPNGYYSLISATGATTYLSKYVTGLAADTDGNLYIADAKASTGGLISKVSSGQLLSIAGNALTGEVDGVGVAAQFSGTYPISDIKLDSLGELIVAEACTMRVIDSNNKVTTIAGSLTTCDVPRDGGGTQTVSGVQANFAGINGIDIDTATDTIYMTDQYSIRKMVPDKSAETSSCHAACWNWKVTTLFNATGATSDVDGPSSVAAFSAPTGIARSSDGTLFVADNLYIRRISANGMVDTITGVPGTVCSSVPAEAQATLPNSTNMNSEPLPGIMCGVQRLVVDPANQQLLFDTADSTSIYTMPY
jgi:hypothetical protein